MRQLAPLFIAGCLFHVSASAQEIDYQKFVETSPWRWDSSAATPFAFAQKFSGECDYEIVYRIKPTTSGLRDTNSIEFWKDGVLRAKIPWSVFAMNGDLLTYVLDERDGTVVQVDLTTGKERWRSVLEGVPILTGTVGYKQFNLDTSDSSIVDVRSNQNGCRYIAVLHSETGKTLGCKVFCDFPYTVRPASDKVNASRGTQDDKYVIKPDK